MNKSIEDSGSHVSLSYKYGKREDQNVLCDAGMELEVSV